MKTPMTSSVPFLVAARSRRPGRGVYAASSFDISKDARLGHCRFGLGKAQRCKCRAPAAVIGALRFLLFWMAAGLPMLGRAGLAEPDNVVYGTIAIASNAVTAFSTNVFVEARLTTNGPPIASYQMGSLPTAGNFYSLRINLEDSSPASATATQTSNTVLIVVRDSNGLEFIQPYLVGARGTFARLDFGSGSNDLNGDGIPDDWELLYLGNLTTSPESIASNGQSVLANYIAGSNPNSTNNLLKLQVRSSSNNQIIVSFQGVKAQGVGYTGVSRLYDLQYGNLSGAWLAVPGYVGLLGNDQTISFSDPGTNETLFYRVRVYLH